MGVGKVIEHARPGPKADLMQRAKKR